MCTWHASFVPAIPCQIAHCIKNKTLVSGTLGYNDRIVAEGNTSLLLHHWWRNHRTMVTKTCWKGKPQHKTITRLQSTHLPRQQEWCSTGQHLEQNYHCLTARTGLVTDVSQKICIKPVVVIQVVVVVVVVVQSDTRSDWCCVVLLMEYWKNITVSLANWCGFTHVNKFLPLIKKIISLSFPLVKPVTYGLGLGGDFFSWGHLIFMFALYGTCKPFYEISASFVYFVLFTFISPKESTSTAYSLPVL